MPFIFPNPDFGGGGGNPNTNVPVGYAQSLFGYFVQVSTNNWVASNLALANSNGSLQTSSANSIGGLFQVGNAGLQGSFIRSIYTPFVANTAAVIFSNNANFPCFVFPVFPATITITGGIGNTGFVDPFTQYALGFCSNWGAWNTGFGNLNTFFQNFVFVASEANDPDFSLMTRLGAGIATKFSLGIPRQTRIVFQLQVGWTTPNPATINVRVLYATNTDYTWQIATEQTLASPFTAGTPLTFGCAAVNTTGAQNPHIYLYSGTYARDI